MTKTESQKIVERELTSENRKRSGGLHDGRVLSMAIIVLLIVIVVLSSWLIFDKCENGGGDEAKIHLESIYYDFGQIEAEEVTTSFPIKNEGDGVLILKEMRTSCDCTVARLIVDGDRNPEFSQSRPLKSKIEIAPGTDAELVVTYDPNVYHDEGAVSRSISMETNDPEREVVEFTISAIVSR